MPSSLLLHILRNWKTEVELRSLAKELHMTRIRRSSVEVGGKVGVPEAEVARSLMIAGCRNHSSSRRMHLCLFLGLGHFLFHHNHHTRLMTLVLLGNHHRRRHCSEEHCCSHFYLVAGMNLFHPGHWPHHEHHVWVLCYRGHVAEHGSHLQPVHDGSDLYLLLRFLHA